MRTLRPQVRFRRGMDKAGINQRRMSHARTTAAGSFTRAPRVAPWPPGLPACKGESPGRGEGFFFFMAPFKKISARFARKEKSKGKRKKCKGNQGALATRKPS